MPPWRCPHCNTPQPETSRCWLCGKVTTACLSCRHFRRGMAGGLALCGRNPKGPVLRGPEVMPCWDVIPPPATPMSAAADGHVPVSARFSRTFVPVEDIARAGEDDALVLAAREAAAIAGRAQPDWGWVLFAELDV